MKTRYFPIKWTYRCPGCASKKTVDWDDRGKKLKCNRCSNQHTIPGPADQPKGYFDTRTWPVEMADAVHAAKGKTCVIQGCAKSDMTLDHIVAWENDGNTSVENLQPMCKSHNSSKSDIGFGEWLADEDLELRK